MNPKLLMSYVVAFVAALITMWAAFEYLRIVPSFELLFIRESITPPTSTSICFHASRYGLGYFLIALCTAVLVKERMIADVMRRVMISGVVIVLALALVLFTNNAMQAVPSGQTVGP